MYQCPTSEQALGKLHEVDAPVAPDMAAVGLHVFVGIALRVEVATVHLIVVIEEISSILQVLHIQRVDVYPHWSVLSLIGNDEEKGSGVATQITESLLKRTAVIGTSADA